MSTDYDLFRRRGDTKPFAFKFWADKKAGVLLNLTGYSFILTVDPESAPETSANNVFSLAGVVDDAASGIVEFEPVYADVDVAPGTYYYDIQVTDPDGKTDTPVLAKVKFGQDITK